MGQADRVSYERRHSGKHPDRNQRRAVADSEFVNYELDKQQQAECAKWREDIQNVVDLWTELIEEGYRVNTKYDNYSSSCAAFIIPDEGSDNGGYILTGRGGDAYRAVANAIYKHAEVCGGVWSKLVAPRDLDRDDTF